MLGELATAVAQAFAVDGALARCDDRFLPRAAQDELAARVARALEQRETLVAEAGTGVGKTFAYLVPLLLSGRRALVSTATKSLQDQLFLRDLPRLRDALGVPLRMALLKGRASYLCRWRLQQAQDHAALPDRFAVRALSRVSQWAQATRNGDLAEIEGLDDRSPVIPLVSSTRDNCLGTECPEFRACHVMQARRDAMAADLVVVNHHLFFADMALRDSGVAELLPTVDAAVFDEAHQLVEAGVQFLGTTLATGQAIDMARDLLAAGLQHARGLQPWAELQSGIDRAARELRLACAGSVREVRGQHKRRWDECAEALPDVLHTLAQACSAGALAAAAVAETAPEFPKLEQRARAVAALAHRFAAEAAPGHVRWVDLSPQQARLVESPLDIRDMLTEQRGLSPKAWIFTSATLGDDEALSWFTSNTGLEDAGKLRVGSPFDYPAHARVWVPADMPLPNATWPPGGGGGAGRPLCCGPGRPHLRADHDAACVARRGAGHCIAGAGPDRAGTGNGTAPHSAAALWRRPGPCARGIAELLGGHRHARRCAAVCADRQAAVSPAQRSAGGSACQATAGAGPQSLRGLLRSRGRGLAQARGRAPDPHRNRSGPAGAV